MGRIGLGFDQQTKRLVVTDIADMNDFGKTMGYRKNDEIVSINGVEITQANAQEYFKNFQNITKAGEDFIVKVMRKDEKGEDKVVELKGVMVKSPVVKFNVLEFSAAATPEQLTLRNYWLKPNGIQVN
jgi:cyclopropane fatty-acyl-phospholipid synthase-like methyltransferase